MNEHNPFAAPTVKGDVVLPYDENSGVDFASLKMTGTGLTMIYVAILLQVLLGFAGAGFGILASRGAGALVFGNFILAFGIFGILVGVMSLVGRFLCTTVPSESGAKAWIVVSAAIQAVSVAFVYFGRFIAGGLGANWMFTLVIPAIATVLLMVFLQKLGTYMQRPDMTRRARRVLILLIVGAIIAVVAVFGGFAPSFVGGQRGMAFTNIGVLLFMVFAMIYGLVVFVMYANVINAFGKYIRNPQSAMPRNHLG
ncbi:MAG: hypothetical protein WAO83_09735 [Fuerstiella sp.]